MSWETIQEGSNKTIVEYDEDRDMYRVSFFDDDWHFLEDVMFDNYTPRKHGEWTHTGHCGGWECSVCKSQLYLSDDEAGHPDYCPQCGARMGKNKQKTSTPRCNKCIHELICAKNLDNEGKCKTYKRDPKDGGFYG